MAPLAHAGSTGFRVERKSAFSFEPHSFTKPCAPEGTVTSCEPLSDPATARAFFAGVIGSSSPPITIAGTLAVTGFAMSDLAAIAGSVRHPANALRASASPNSRRSLRTEESAAIAPSIVSY